MVGIFRLS